MTLALMLIAGLVTGLYFDALSLAALCVAILLVGGVCVAWTGAWHSMITLLLGIFVVQMGYAIGILVDECEGRTVRAGPSRGKALASILSLVSKKLK